jgi:hypothetical protein
MGKEMEEKDHSYYVNVGVGFQQQMSHMFGYTYATTDN